MAEEGLPQSVTLGPGDLNIVDDHRVLHGRRSVHEASSRLLRRVKAFRRSGADRRSDADEVFLATAAGKTRGYLLLLQTSAIPME